jgi:hypothetical protein
MQGLTSVSNDSFIRGKQNNRNNNAERTQKVITIVDRKNDNTIQYKKYKYKYKYTTGDGMLGEQTIQYYSSHIKQRHLLRCLASRLTVHTTTRWDTHNNTWMSY